MTDGGQAFPTALVVQPGHYATGELGMTLRDWFAGQALTKVHDGGFRALPENVHTLAAYCYRVADAMLAERAK